MLGLFLFAACSLEQPTPTVRAPPPGAGTQPPVAAAPPGAGSAKAAPDASPRITQVSLQPAAPRTTEDVKVVVEASDPDGDPVDLDYVWVINGQRRPDKADDVLPHDNFVKGDTLSVDVTASDGDKELMRSSHTITVADSAPTFTQDPRASLDHIDGLQLHAEDPDGDPITFRLSGAPPGMAIDPRTGRLSYQGSADDAGGSFQPAVQMDDGDGGTATWTFQMQVQPGSKAIEAQKAAQQAAKKPQLAPGQ